MKISPQFQLTIGLVALVLSTVLVADLVGLLPRSEAQLRDSRRVLGESFAVQLSSAASNGGDQYIETVLEEIVRRDGTVLYAGLFRENGRELASFGSAKFDANANFDFSSYDNLVIPIYQRNVKWGEARLSFAQSEDFALRYIGIPTETLLFVLFLGAACLITFSLFMRKALAELNPTKAVPQRVNAAFDVLAEGVLIIDEQQQIVLANQSIAKRLGEEPEFMIGKNPDSYQWDLCGDDLEELPWQTAIKHAEHVVGMPLKAQVDDELIAFTVNAAPVEDGQGGHKGVLITFDDVTPLESKNTELANMLAELSVTQKIIEDKNQQLELLATIDPLTGCLNRRSFMSKYKEQHSQARSTGAPLVVFMVDIDHFKQVNDNYGHPVGDQVIKMVAGTLQTHFSRQEFVGRFGGEEFIVSIPGLQLREAMRVAERLRIALSELANRDELPLTTLTASIGVASLDEQEVDPEELIDRADRALYQAKNTGRNKVCHFDPDYAPVAKKQPGDTEPAERTGSGKTVIVKTLKSELESMQKIVRKQANEITHKSMHDEFTGLPNRFLLQDRLSQAIKLSDRNGNMTAVVSISLSGYQKLDDLLGHDAADEMISEAARRVERVVRSADSIGVAFNEQALTFSRIADNELAMLIVDLDAVESVPKIISRITRALEKAFIVNDNEFLNDVYCGIALYPHDGNETDVLIRNASLARSYAKHRSPRSDNAYFSRDIDELATKNAAIAVELRKAIANDGLNVIYQPKVNAVTKQVTGIEALARWTHSELGDIGPTEFITIAENIGVINQLTDWVVSRVCEDISDVDLGGLRVSINVSPLELHDAGTSDRILNIVREKGVSPGQLEIEITESSILNNFDMARTILKRFQNEGVLVVLDDFGTAYSSLNLLIEIPVDIIKIDRSFVAEIHNAHDNKAVVQAIIQMARTMGKRVVAEGVETVAERDCLIDLGCREIQGYLYSTPLTFEDLQAYIKKFGVYNLSSRTALNILEKTA